MTASAPSGSTYTIDRDERTEPPGVQAICAAAGLEPEWLTRPDEMPLHSAGWLQPGHPPALAVAGSAACAWLGSAPGKALEEARKQGLSALLASPALLESIAAEAPPSIALGAIDADPAEAVLALREALMHARAPVQTVYAVLADVFDLGVLIVGPAGVGKSELALELLARGHRLVADDVVEMRRLPGELIVGSAPALLQDFLEVRGLGVLDVARMFGAQALVPRRRVDFLMELMPVRDAPTDYRARLAGLRGEARMLDLPVPTICLPIRVGHNLATLVEAACRDQWLRLQGYRADEAFADRQQHAIDVQSTKQ